MHIRFLPTLLLFTLVSVFAFSQSSTSGSITGVVTDPSGAVVPNAKVTITSDATGQVLNTTTNGERFYRFAFLQPGSYTLTTTAPEKNDNDPASTLNVKNRRVSSIRYEFWYRAAVTNCKFAENTKGFSIGNRAQIVVSELH
jgi:hypothetical protein